MKIKYVIALRGTKKEVSKYEFYKKMRFFRSEKFDFHVVDSWVYDYDAFLCVELRKVKTLTIGLTGYN